MKVNIHWFRRDLRLEDNRALELATHANFPVLPIFIFDTEILHELENDDARVSFIHERLTAMDHQLKELGSGIQVFHGQPYEVWKDILEKYDVSEVYFNKDYEPYARERDANISELLKQHGVQVHALKDHVVFEESEVMKPDGSPYTVFTPYRNKWMERFQEEIDLKESITNGENFAQVEGNIIDINNIGFNSSAIKVRGFNLTDLDNYEAIRNLPAKDATSYLSVHLRFGTVCPRQVFRQVSRQNISFMNELIWREFFLQIIFHFPQVVNENFKVKYDGIQWRNKEEEFERWCKGETGFPMVDAGMRQLNQSGYMHNRVRMVTASFLTKHLLIDWRWGEAYFAKKLLDFDLAINNGNWQWAAGTGCDAAPYFRVFNPTEQMKRFDPTREYVRNWVPEVDELNYAKPMVEHKIARERALKTYKIGLQGG
jgi:deoxyribodipyrimidine photo-lyase